MDEAYADTTWGFESRIYSGSGDMNLCCVAQEAIFVLEPPPSLRMIFAMWFSIVRSERWSSWAMWRLENPRATKAATSCSRLVRGSSVAPPAGGLLGRWERLPLRGH